MKALVTGSAGFIGSHLVAALREREWDVVEIDKKTGIDLRHPAKDIVMVERPDIVFHLAGSCSTPGSIDRPLETFNDTVVSTAHLIDAVKPFRTPVILTSSVKARDGLSPYGAAKIMAERWALEHRKAYSLPLVINRPGTVYGPGQEGSEESGWIAWFVKARNEGLPVVINGDGNQVRDLLHVSDYVNLMLMQAKLFGDYEGHIWDVGGGNANAVTVRQIADHLGLKYSFGPARYGDERRLVGYNDAPGWGPQVYWRDSETLR